MRYVKPVQRSQGRRGPPNHAANFRLRALGWCFLVGSISAAPPCVAGSASSLRADLPTAELEALADVSEGRPDPLGARELLEEIYRLDDPHRYEADLVSVSTDRRWFGTTPADVDGAPLLEVRRWPGDTVLAVYALRGAEPGSGGVPGLSGVRMSGPRVEGDSWRWEGTIPTPAGDRRATWVERKVADGPARLGGLLVPGDAGLGAGAAESLALEAEVVWDRVEVHADAWERLDPATAPATVSLPVLGLVPGTGDEANDPWQVASGIGFTLGVPPGIRSIPLRPDFRGPRPVPDAVLWLRGRYVDGAGTRVVVGDERRAGYVCVIHDPDPGWAKGKVAPRGAPEAEGLAAVAFEPSDLVGTGASSARAERWKETAFEGQWLVFRLSFEPGGVEIGLPVLTGRTSESLFWIPLTWRGPGRPPAPPPVDPAKRFGIRFERLSPADRRRRPWSEGHLRVPGLVLELPREWWPKASLRTDDGFPVSLVDETGQRAARLSRLSPEAFSEASMEEWRELDRPRRFQARAAFAREDGARLWVAKEGHAFRLEPVVENLGGSTVWEALADSAALLRTGR